MMDSTTWNGQDHALSSVVEDDFQQFLDLGGMTDMGNDIQFDFNDFDGGNVASVMQQPSRDTLDTPMTGIDNSSVMAKQQHNGVPFPSHMPVTTTSAPPSSHIMPQSHTMDALGEIDAQIQFLQHQRLQQQQRQLEEQQRQFEAQQAAFFAQQQRSMVPPTPQSLELSGASHFYSQQDQTQQPTPNMYDGYQRLKEQQDQMAFTPLVSPAVTPLDGQFPAEAQYSMPGAYFSPLTSPALHAQNESFSIFEHMHPGTSTNSPVDLDLDSNAASGSMGDLAKKVRKSNANKTRKSAVRQSPITKPQRRKTASTPTLNSQALGELSEIAAEKSEYMNKGASVSNTSESENASISPEALSDMPPPPIPKPKSARQSPFIQPQNHSAPSSTATHPIAAAVIGKPSPATPASLFRISPQNKSTDDARHSGQLASEHIDNFELPESANFHNPKLTPLMTQSSPIQPPSTESELTKGSSFQPLPSPASSKPRESISSASQSPQLTPTASSTPNPRKTPQLAPRSSKKRSSTCSVQVSPALRPKISPNIKPLLPGTPAMSAEDSASRLLTSKSNYQNILEGNSVPGVSYPSELSTNLTSKRTSHKLAEQGRRNRINIALQEIAALLPRSLQDKEGESADGEEDATGGVVNSSAVNKKEGKDGKDKSGGINGPNSKASTVEMAIEYIKQLKEEVAAANSRVVELEKRLGTEPTEQASTVMAVEDPK